MASGVTAGALTCGCVGTLVENGTRGWALATAAGADVVVLAWPDGGAMATFVDTGGRAGVTGGFAVLLANGCEDGVLNSLMA
jgi:hypothetical protein